MTSPDNRNWVSRQEFHATFEQCKNWGRWGDRDDRGALNFIGEEQVRAATALVGSGHTISCARPLDTIPGPDNPLPVRHLMTTLPDVITEGSGDVRFTGDYIGLDIHGDAPSHIDALCHVAYRGLLFNGVRIDETVSSRGARSHDIGTARRGIASRGVLLDFPRLHGINWLEPGHAITVDEFVAAEEKSGTTLRQGDLLFVRTGHTERRRAHGPWNTAEQHAGLHSRVMPLLHQREIAAIASDTDSDTAPSNCEDTPWPIHAIGIVSMGLHMIDHLDLEELSAACVQHQTSEFMCVVAPLVLEGATGSPVNPIAII